MAESDVIKTCRKCGVSSPPAVFPVGRAQCSECIRAHKTAQRNQPHVKVRERETRRKWGAENAEYLRAYVKSKLADPEVKARRVAGKKDHYERNRDYIAAKAWLRRLHASEEFMQRERATAARHRPAALAKRRAAMKNALPSWADLVEIKAVYAGAKRMSEKFRRVFHVDHIVPLSSETVCGLHVTANLQVLEKSLNHEKNNHWWPDMWQE